MWSSAYGKYPRAHIIRPTKLRVVTKVKSIRYVLNHSLNNIHRLTFFFGGCVFGFGAGIVSNFSTGRRLVEKSLDSLGEIAGRASVKTGTLEDGVIPS